ncbi:hypothetical protein B0I35DRAFT_480680 [Stachybotrys elegans]|uniref:Mating-type switching protein swi10 n=1 Tax=Stachybotrys elegans TaxID=80388 RepID=A0A8K0SH36_9HYPO|nr:hypothetical protein B0I35DRAFT_480680 [Stachybotrys elegans]
METLGSRVFPLVQSLRPSRRKLQKKEAKSKRDSKTHTCTTTNTTTAAAANANKNNAGVNDKKSPIMSTSPHLDKAPTPTTSTPRHMSVVGVPKSPVRPDLSDSKWGDYLDQQDAMSSSETTLKASPSPSEMTIAVNNMALADDSQPPLIPEFSHLRVKDASLRLSTASSTTVWPETRRMSTASRRHAKTPVFHIGQLEKSASMRHGQKPCRIDIIAEQYRALLESRGHDDAEAVYTASHSATPALAPALPLNATRIDTIPEIPPRGSVRALRLTDKSSKSSSPSPHRQDSPAAPSPTSDGTLVAFEEDTIYFKPISFSTEPSPTANQHSLSEEAKAPRRGSQGNLGLSISVDLLTKELSSVFLDKNTSTDSDPAALQVWVMIEAYERLQQRLSTLNLPEADVQNAKTAMGSWLTSLYAVHASLTGSDNMSESDYGELAENLD